MSFRTVILLRVFEIYLLDPIISTFVFCPVVVCFSQSFRSKSFKLEFSQTRRMRPKDTDNVLIKTNTCTKQERDKETPKKGEEYYRITSTTTEKTAAVVSSRTEQARPVYLASLHGNTADTKP